MILSKEFRFEASHVLPKHKGKCSRLHGHSWVLRVEVDGRLDRDSGFVMDYGDISAAVKPLVDALDHRHLGAWAVFTEDREGKQDGDKALRAEIWGSETDPYFASWRVPGLPENFNPTSENLLWWIGDQLETKLDWHKLILEETCTSRAELTKQEFRHGWRQA